eukprot:11026217-Ditylum_brightwellii.AAC.1
MEEPFLPPELLPFLPLEPPQSHWPLQPFFPVHGLQPIGHGPGGINPGGCGIIGGCGTIGGSGYTGGIVGGQ